MPVITCAEPGCTNPIKYCKDDDEVPLYCPMHRTEEGRHAAVRVLHVPYEDIKEPEPTVVMRCINSCCHHRTTILRSEWMNGVLIVCPECNGNMLYHKDAEPEKPQ